MNKKEIYICGVNHLDFNGPKNLRKILKKIKPEIITLEYTKEDYKEIIKDHQDWLKNIKEIQKGIEKLIKEKPNKKLIKEIFSTIGYEAWVSDEYALNRKVKIVFLEDREISEKATEQILQKIDIKNFFIKSFGAKTEDFQEEIRRSKGNKKISGLAEVVKRNKIFARKIEKLDGKILVICGIYHLKGQEPTLKKLLAKYKPKIIDLSN